MPDWTAVRIDDVEAVPWQGTELRWHPLRAALGTLVAGIAAFTAPRVGQELVEEHVESADGRGHEELYVVLRGRAAFTLDGEALDAPAGTIVRAGPTVRRHAVAAEPDTAGIAIGGPREFQPSASEWIERARPLIRSDPERARALIDELRAERPQSAGIAIGEALLAMGRGESERAAELLAELLAREPELRAPLSRDPDLGSLV